jgi:hypothetical protein
MSEEDVARYGAEGAAMTLDQAVAYALEGGEPSSTERTGVRAGRESEGTPAA